jgi:hypothetical protein
MEYSALYYPYASVKTQDLLNKSLLLYDSLYIITPSAPEAEQVDIAYSGDKSDVGRGYDEWNDSMRLLERENFIRPIDPEQYVRDYEPAFTEMLQNDLGSQAIRDEVERWNKGDWILYSGKVPPTVFQMLRAPQNHLDDYTVRLSFAHGESIMITHALLASATKSLTPITDAPVHRRFLSLRLQEGAQRLNSHRSDFESNYGIRLGDIRTKQDFLEKKLIEMTLPDIKKTDPRTILDFRNDHQDELAKFRSGVAALTKRLEELERLDEGRDFGTDIADLIENVIRPSYEKLRDESEFKWGRFLSNVFSGKKKKVPLEGFALEVFGSLPTWVGLLGNTGFMLGKGAIKEEIRRREVLKSNPLTYMLKAEKKLG